MFTGRNKSNLVPVAALLALALILSFGVAIAGASPPEALNFDFDVTYYNLPTTVASGSWSSGGLFTGGGSLVEDSNHAGSGPGVCFRTVHTTDTLEDQNGTITLRMQMTQNEGGGCATANMQVSWVIVSGTGAYADLHGQGGGTATGHVEFVADGTLNYVLSYDLDGQGHYE